MRLSTPAQVAQGAAASSRRRAGYRSWRDRFFFALFIASVVIGIAGLVTLLLTVIIDAWGWLDWQFITSYASRRPERAGIF